MQSLTTNTTTAAAGTGPSFQETMIELTPQSSSAAQGSNLYSFDRVFLQRLGRLLRILFQSSGHDRFWSTSKRARQSSVFWLYVVFVTVSCGNEVLYYYVGLLPSRFYGLLSSQDLPGFSAFILPCLVLVFGAAAVCSAWGVKSIILAVKEMEGLIWSKWHRCRDGVCSSFWEDYLH